MSSLPIPATAPAQIVPVHALQIITRSGCLQYCNRPLQFPCANAGEWPAITGRERLPTGASMDMTAPKTLLELAGADLRPPRLRDACLVLIDLQYEYLAGPIALPDARRAIVNTARLLARARAEGSSIFHIAHKGRPGRMFDR